MNQSMTTIWDGGLRFVHTSATGHELVTDVPVENGGTNTAPTPLELVLLGLIGCTGVDVTAILTKMKEPLEGLEVSADFERAEKQPRVYTRIHLYYKFRGKLDDKKVQRAIKLSETKYCSVSAMVGQTAKITHEYTIED